MLKCLNFQNTSIFSKHRGIKYMKSVLFWKFVMSSYNMSASDLVSLSLLINVFIFFYKYPFTFICFASSSSLILACRFKSKPGISGHGGKTTGIWSQTEGGRHPGSATYCPGVFGHVYFCICKMEIIEVE